MGTHLEWSTYEPGTCVNCEARLFDLVWQGPRGARPKMANPKEAPSPPGEGILHRIRIARRAWEQAGETKVAWCDVCYHKSGIKTLTARYDHPFREEGCCFTTSKGFQACSGAILPCCMARSTRYRARMALNKGDLLQEHQARFSLDQPTWGMYGEGNREYVLGRPMICRRASKWFKPPIDRGAKEGPLGELTQHKLKRPKNEAPWEPFSPIVNSGWDWVTTGTRPPITNNRGERRPLFKQVRTTMLRLQGRKDVAQLQIKMTSIAANPGPGCTPLCVGIYTTLLTKTTPSILNLTPQEDTVRPLPHEGKGKNRAYLDLYRKQDPMQGHQSDSHPDPSASASPPGWRTTDSSKEGDKGSQQEQTATGIPSQPPVPPPRKSRRKEAHREKREDS